jgi:glutaredoxin
MNKKLTILSIIFVILIIISIILIIKDNKKEIVSIPNVQNNQTEKIEIKEENKEILNIEDKKIEPDLPIIPKKHEGIILFYGDGCPHCAIVEEFIKENKIDVKISFSKKEVYYNKENSSLLIEKAKICNFDTNSIGIPFLWDGTRCLVGDQDIIEFLKLKAGI